MKFIVLGTSEFALRCARGLQDAGGEVCALVSMPSQIRPSNSADVAAFARKHGVAYREAEDINRAESVDMLREFSSDYIFCTWPRMLKSAVLEIPKFFCIGSHPTKLPFNRGRHPLHWLIAQGIARSELSFFRMDEGVDTGNLLLQVPYLIEPNDSIVEVNSKVHAAAFEGARTLCEKLVLDPSNKGNLQDHSLSNTWRKRTPHDVTLDMRMPSSVILRIVRSYAPPYPCANLLFENTIIKVTKASVANISDELGRDQLQRIEPGKVISTDGDTIRIKVDDAILDLACETPLPTRVLKAKYIHPPTKYIAEWPLILSP